MRHINAFRGALRLTVIATVLAACSSNTPSSSVAAAITPSTSGAAAPTEGQHVQRPSGTLRDGDSCTQEQASQPLGAMSPGADGRQCSCAVVDGGAPRWQCVEVLDHAR